MRGEGGGGGGGETATPRQIFKKIVNKNAMKAKIGTTPPGKNLYFKPVCIYDSMRLGSKWCP
jgi:hypothetical protein